jgi:hypothetical protein
MSGIEWDGDDPADLAERLNRLPTVLESHLEAAATDIGERIRGDANENAPRDTGDLGNLLEAVTNVGATLVEIRVGSNLEYAAAHEFGVDAGEIFPPSSELRDWARRVLGDPDMAFPVAESIHESGLEEQRYLRDAFEDNLTWTVDRINDAVTDAFEEVGLA